MTINLDNKGGLLRTLKSLDEQECREFELIIVDGESVDGSQEVISEFLEVGSVANVIYICEKDCGIYDAMNKGLSLATGELILFLNSGDCLDSSKVVDSVASVEGGFDVIYGDLKVCDRGHLREIRSNPTICFFMQYQHDLPPQPAVFFRRTVIQDLGGFDLSYKIIADVVLIANIFANPDTTYFHLDLVITNFDPSGVSSAHDNQLAIMDERERFISEKYPQYLSDLKAYYKSDRSLKRRVFSKIRSLYTNLC